MLSRGFGALSPGYAGIGVQSLHPYIYLHVSDNSVSECQGTRDNTKRREMLTWLRAKHFSIYMLQEVHCTNNASSIWSAECGYQAIFSNYKSNKAGVCILFNDNFNLQIKKVFIDPKDVLSSATLKPMKPCELVSSRLRPDQYSGSLIN